MEKYPTFKRGEVQKAFNKLPKKDKEVIESYIKYISITSKSRVRLENNKRGLTEFRILTNRPLDKITLKDLRGFLALLNTSEKTQATRNDLKHTVKRFLKWKFKDWSERFENLKDIKLVMRINEEKINSNTLLKKEDIEKIIKEEPRLFWKAFFITLYESGLRPIELRTLVWKNIKFDTDKEGLSEINIYATKTHRARTVYIKESTFYLKRLREGSKSELVFPSPRDKTKPMSKELPAMWLRRISQKVLGRQVYPYILRHSRATELYTNVGIPDKTAQKFLGHSKSMADIYTHLSSKDVKEAVSKTIYKTEELPPQKKHKLEQQILALTRLSKFLIKKELKNKKKLTLEEKNQLIAINKELDKNP